MSVQNLNSDQAWVVCSLFQGWFHCLVNVDSLRVSIYGLLSAWHSKTTKNLKPQVYSMSSGNGAEDLYLGLRKSQLWQHGCRLFWSMDWSLECAVHVERNPAFLDVGQGHWQIWNLTKGGVSQELTIFDKPTKIWTLGVEQHSLFQGVSFKGLKRGQMHKGMRWRYSSLIWVQGQ